MKYAAVDGGGGPTRILVSKERIGTYSFDTAAEAWSKAGDWTLPFSGRAEYVPEHGLWFGLGDDGPFAFCAVDLAAATARRPPPVRKLWRSSSKLAVPASLTVDEDHLYVLGTVPCRDGWCFECLEFDRDGDEDCHGVTPASSRRHPTCTTTRTRQSAAAVPLVCISGRQAAEASGLQIDGGWMGLRLYFAATKQAPDETKLETPSCFIDDRWDWEQQTCLGDEARRQFIGFCRDGGKHFLLMQRKSGSGVQHALTRHTAVNSELK
ncbi:hypothetical protein C2845_PM05G02760 [Panicum miliaceum]|uniref:Uncharacterized protein n=1 Tax=Panicum miliaceum TaxID=4540 RepID=A0A3L6SWI1_PANMI|nr:hypothetical protein C2845_PM05G02760 [Panicum miliaceum]